MAMPRLLSKSAVALCVGGALLCQANTASAVPATVAVRGAIHAVGGAPGADGKYLLKFAIYSADKGGTAAWSEPAVPMMVQGGAFVHVLGQSKALTAELLAALPQAWLGVTVDVDPELPRVPLHSVTSALSAGGLSCTGCVKAEHLSKGAISADKLGFAYAGSKTKGGPADLALGLQCTGCVPVAAMKFDADMDLGGNAIKAKQLSAGIISAAAVNAQSFVGDGSKLTGIKTPAGVCAKTGETVKGINPDGSLLCTAGGNLPPDGIDEISNNLIHNQFIDSAKSTKEVPVPDNNPIGAFDEIIFPDVGLAQKLTVQVEVQNSNLAALALTLFDPNNVGYKLLVAGQGKGTKLTATYPEPDKPAEGDLTTWVGKNPKGKWRLKAVDGEFFNNKFDGAIKSWRIDIQTLSSQKIQVKGDLYVDGAGYFGAGVRFGDLQLPCTAANAGAIRFTGTLFEGCTGLEWTAFIAPGATQSSALTDCAAIKKVYPQAQDGLYWIDPNGGSKADAVQAVCDMKRDGGGWTLGIKHWYQSGLKGNTAAYGNVAVALAVKGTPYKLSDDSIRSVIGPDQNFDVLFDQAGYNSQYSNGNYEYVVIRNYTAKWTWGGLVPASSTATTVRSYRLSDNALAWEGNFKCGKAGGWGINCYDVTAGTNPSGGSGCKINMGKATNNSWHHVYMAETNTDTYLYMCNGPQHSSSHNMNHRFWFRKAQK